MQFQSFDWLSGHAVPAIIPCPRNSDHKLFSGCSCKAKSAKSSNISWMIKKYYSTRACWYEMIIAISALKTRLLPSARWWNNARI